MVHVNCFLISIPHSSIKLLQGEGFLEPFAIAANITQSPTT